MKFEKKRKKNNIKFESPGKRASFSSPSSKLLIMSQEEINGWLLTLSGSLFRPSSTLFNSTIALNLRELEHLSLIVPPIVHFSLGDGRQWAGGQDTRGWAASRQNWVHSCMNSKWNWAQKRYNPPHPSSPRSLVLCELPLRHCRQKSLAGGEKTEWTEASITCNIKHWCYILAEQQFLCCTKTFLKDDGTTLCLFFLADVQQQQHNNRKKRMETW